ncbi:EVE domain-containing protein [Xanthobacter sp. DSM 24535]|uniref:EVE domain-containing protein n=1 Tax=Roseixanthobacter psychrophilus TaxID=3119917 RepID=UPI0037277372
MAFWMGVASAQHARGGRDGGFAQLGHGKHIAVKSLRKGDWIVYYSPREGMGEGETVQAFTTIGRVTSDAPYRAEQVMNFNPYRVDVDYLKDAKPAPIRPLLGRLRLTRDHVANWGIVMRGPKRGLNEEDMRLIAEAMGVLGRFEQLSRPADQAPVGDRHRKDCPRRDDRTG